MLVEHPRAGDGPGNPPAAVDVNGESSPVDGGRFEVPGDAHSWLEHFASAYDTTPDALIVGETCGTVMDNGEVCGRETPCPYHSDEEE
ncbi:hypothetical protein [Natrialba taiwanensis]|uniref:Uncharacterized protein n=1 Tax=Natrialba taiwanensis DSM 12281 TaxID=1230458 RepID=M0ADF5_9EURY|nr:hypothetical protein [Natrialba taiwanensis]ELY96544.1 hypothetical protein C484_00935 [Natrialba taiwanensis DSM 12281]